MNYHPWEMERFRTALRDGRCDSFENIPVRTAHVTITPDDNTARLIAPAEEHLLTGPERLFGTPADASCLHDVATYRLGCPPTLLHRVTDAVIIGSATVVTQDGRIYCPDIISSPVDLAQLAQFNSHNSQQFILQPQSESSATVHYFWQGTEQRLAGTALFLAVLEPGNYGSFLFRVLPQLFAAASLGLTYDFIVASARTHWLLDAIRLTGLPLQPILLPQEIFGARIATLIFFNDFYVEGFFTRDTARAFHDLARRVTPAAGPDPSNGSIYVSRTLAHLRTPHYRKLDNEMDLEARARARGYAVVYPETLTFVEQIGRFHRSHRIAGASGSGMLNAVFTPAGGRVLDIESFHVTVRQHAKIYSSTGKSYSFCFGEFDGNDQRVATVRTWHLDPDQFDAALDWLA